MQNKKGETPLHFLAINGYPKIVEKVLAKKPSLGIKDNQGNTPLHFSAMYGHTKATLHFIRAGASADDKRKMDGSTPLHLATINGFS